MTRQIIIIGFMGAGKTTVARELSLRLNCPAVDLDELITNNEGRSPKQIIEQDGEMHFRKIESETLRDVLVEGAARIVAVGGGAWTIAQNRETVADQRALAVWLDAPFELCWKRIESGNAARPLARSREAAEELYRYRRGSYALADARITVAEYDTVEETTTKVFRECSREDPNTRKEPGY